MNFFPVADILAANKLVCPDLEVLSPSISNYQVMLLQPEGDIDASGAKVCNRDTDLAIKQYTAYLDAVLQYQPHLAVTPEYSLPWAVLIKAIQSGAKPTTRGLWAFGCESITYSELQAMATLLVPHGLVLFEDLPDAEGSFFDPLAYVFRTKHEDGSERLVILIQFKTHPMSDPDHFEISKLQTGNRIYVFGTKGETIRLAAMICSDAMVCNKFGFAAYFDERCIVLHIQLNGFPRHKDYRKYRDELFECVGDTTEVIALNWAGGVKEWNGLKTRNWGNIAGSAWYLRPDRFDFKDATLRENHRKGLYYTWLDGTKSHALYFNYCTGFFRLESTKAWHKGVPAAQSRRRGPKVLEAFNWCTDSQSWKDAVSLSDGFAEAVQAVDPLGHALTNFAANDPISAERLLALCSGAVLEVGDWHMVKKLDCFFIDGRESLQRLTFALDHEEPAPKFRKERLYRFRNLRKIVEDAKNIPPALTDLSDGFHWTWSENLPHSNVLANDGKPATVIYVGESVDDAGLKSIAQCMLENLHRVHVPQTRLAIWYRRDGDLFLYDLPDSYSYDRPGDSSAVDIARQI